MARLSTCKGCGKKLQPEEKYIHASKTYCEECYKKIERESTEYKQLIEFICNNYELDKPTGFMLKQIKELKTEYGYSYAAMTYTLWYCKEILNKSLIEKYGEIESVDEWGKRRLAYSINDLTEGYYVLVNFKSKPDFPAELERVYGITDGIIRDIVVKCEED